MTFDLKFLETGMQAAFPATDDAAQKLMETLRHRHRRRKIVTRIINVVAFGPLLLFVSWIAAQALDRSPPALVTDVLKTSKVVAGGFLVDEITILEKTRSCDLKISWIIFDGDNEVHTYQLPALPASIWARRDRPAVHQTFPGSHEPRARSVKVSPDAILRLSQQLLAQDQSDRRHIARPSLRDFAAGERTMMAGAKVLLVIYTLSGGKLSFDHQYYQDLVACRTAAATNLEPLASLHFASAHYLCIDMQTGKKLAAG